MTKPGAASAVSSPPLEELGRQLSALEASHQYSQAAQLAERAGLYQRASALFERACLFGPAARCAQQGQNLPRAALLAVLAGEETLLDNVLQALSQDPLQARNTAETLRLKGYVLAAARLFEQLQDWRAAAEAYLEANRPIDAARAYQRVGDALSAARVLESALRQDPTNEQLLLTLGTLLVEHHRHEPALRLLQRLGPSSPLYPQVRPLLASCYQALSLHEPLRKLGPQPPPQAPEGPSPQAPELLHGRYQVQRIVASSHAAQVLQALDRLTNQPVAIKQVLVAQLVGAGRDAFDRLVREAKALEQLRHPNVMPLVELLPQANVIVTPWMPGGSLSTLLEQDSLVPARAVELISSVLTALAEAHRLGILHRDIKPSNILLDEAGNARLADFGAAHLSDSSVTATAAVIGTLAYMSPEQREGRPATAASDIYSVGATLLELLTGEPPRTTLEGPARLPSHAHPEMGPEHDRIALALVAHSPTDRPQSALQARSLIGSVSWPQTQSQPSPRPPAPVPQALLPERLEPLANHWARDKDLGRTLMLVPATPEMLRIARIYAACASDALSAVLKVDPASQQIWFEVPEGTSLEPGARLTARQAAPLQTALEALHAKDVVHGAIDPAHLVIRGEIAVLRFEPDTVQKATAEQDQKALRALIAY